MTENKNVILSARDIVVEFDVRDRVLTAIRGVSLDLVAVSYTHLTLPTNSIV